MVRFLVLHLALFLAACAPQSGAIVNDHIGVGGTYSPQMPISDHPHHVLMGHVIDVTRDATRVRALVVHQRRDGVQRLWMREAWSNGIELPFQQTSRRLNGCTHGACRDRSLGMIFLSDALFAYASVNGLNARLIGRDGGIDIYAPPELFQALPQSPAQPAR